MSAVHGNEPEEGTDDATVVSKMSYENSIMAAEVGTIYHELLSCPALGTDSPCRKFHPYAIRFVTHRWSTVTR